MSGVIIAGFLTLALTTIGHCQPNMPKQPKGNFCKFDEQLTGRVYDFTKLIGSNDDRVLRNDKNNETVKFQLCHELHTFCNSAGGYAACMEYGNETIGIGKYPPRLSRENGTIVFRFIGDECSNDTQYTLSVIMHCDYSGSDETPVLIPYEKKQCDVYISWKTKLACGSEAKKVDCTVKNSAGELFDLSSLKSENENYVIPRDNKSSIVLNVCHSVIPGYGAVCPVNSGACLKNESSSIAEYINLGDVQAPTLVNGTVTLQYTEGRMCTDGDHTQTTISFICDFNSHNTLPALTKNTTSCHYQLLWRTVAACSDKQLEEFSAKNASPCKIRDPVTNFLYDLESLKGQDYIIQGSGSSHKISICGPLTSNACGENAGVCFSQNRTKTTKGQANSQLSWSPNGLYLNYTNGSICEGDKRHYTIISFICAPKDETNVPRILVDVGCYLKIQWPTPLVCENQNNPCDPPESPACSNKSTNTTSPTASPVIPPTKPPAQPTVPPTAPPVVPQPTIKPNNSTPDRSTNDSITTDSTSQSKSENGGTSASHGGLIAFVVIFIAFGLLCGVYLANPDRRSNLYTTCSSFFLRRSPTRMSYSQEL